MLYWFGNQIDLSDLTSSAHTKDRYFRGRGWQRPNSAGSPKVPIKADEAADLRVQPPPAARDIVARGTPTTAAARMRLILLFFEKLLK